MAQARRRSRDIPEVEPLDVDGVRTISIFTTLWAVAFVFLALRKDTLDAAGQGWWLWTCLAGVGLGLLGIEHSRRRRDAIADALLLEEAEAETGERPVVDDDEVRGDASRNDEREGASGDDAGTAAHRAVEPLTDPGVRVGPVATPATDPRAVTRPIESTTPPRSRPAPGAATPSRPAPPSRQEPSTSEPPVGGPGAARPGALPVERQVARAPERPAPRPEERPAVERPAVERPGVARPAVARPTVERPAPGMAERPAPRAADPLPRGSVDRDDSADTSIQQWLDAGPGDRLPPRRASRPATSTPPVPRDVRPDSTGERPAEWSRSHLDDSRSNSLAPDLLEPQSRSTMPTVGDADEPLLDTLGGRRARNYDVGEEIDAIDEATEGGGTIYRGRRARRRSDSA